MKSFCKIIISFLLIISLLFSVTSCAFFVDTSRDTQTDTESEEKSFYINGENRYVLKKGEKITLTLTINENIEGTVVWSSSHSCVSVDDGEITALSYGTAVVKATIGDYSDSVIILVPGIESGSTDTDTENGDSSEGNDTTDSDDTNIGGGDNTDSDDTTDTDNETNDKDDGSNDTNDDNTNDDNTDDGTDSDENDGFADGYDTITVGEALKIAEQYTSAPSSEKYYIVATVRQISSAKDGRMYIYDDTGSIYVYKSTMLDGSRVSASSLKAGDVVLISGTLRDYNGTLEIDSGIIVDFRSPYAPPEGDDPYENVDVDEFYASYKPATSYEDAYFRTQHNLMSGTIADQDQAPTISLYQPTKNGKFIRNSEMLYSEDGNVYYVVDAYGEIVMEIYRGAAYIMLEEVAAHVFAFGEPPANQTASKNTKPTSSEWGIYLRLNHSSFSGSTSSYPYEPELPNISGCGGTLNYYEMDVGTTGTDCDPSYPVAVYNNGKTITRGAARIVYVCEDDDQNGTIDPDERYVFYTYNHYNDFQEYLNYYGGWGEMFGNITGGGTISSKYDYNPTPYVETVLSSLKSSTDIELTEVILFIDTRKFYIYS